MLEKDFIKFIAIDKQKQFIYKVAVFTVSSYKELVASKGINYVIDLFMEVCREKNCKFLGFNFDGGYVFALIGFSFEYVFKKKQQYLASTL